MGGLSIFSLAEATIALQLPVKTDHHVLFTYNIDSVTIFFMIA